ICRQSKCVALQSKDCVPTPLGDFTDDNAVVVGFLHPFTGDDSTKAVGELNLKGLKLANKELVNSVVGIPGPNNVRRPVVWVICDEIADIERTANHLIDDLGAAAILGPAFSSSTLTLVSKVTVAKNVLVLSPTSNSPNLTKYDDHGLLW